MNLFEGQLKRRREREGARPSICRVTAQIAAVSRAKPSQSHAAWNQGLPHGYQDPSIAANLCYLSRCSSGELGQKWSSGTQTGAPLGM